MRVTFLNDNVQGNLETIGLKNLERRAEDFEFFSKYGYCEDDDDFMTYLKQNAHDSLKELEKEIQQWRETSRYLDYGLSFDFQEANQEEQKEAYFRFQLSWGGPSDELRFYEDGTIIYVFLDWFCGVGFDVTDEDWADWVRDDYEGMEMMPWEEKDYEERHLMEYEEDDEEE
jgi:hypothetical protein